ncbi:MAG: phenylalanine--tRNA ligase beta subunit-related protein [Candidatus Nanopelagicales bacterium]|jgi:DNA/RNA-binding domain of Phe-tRNA-synthetase-like protein
MSAAWDGDLASATVDPEVFALRPDYVAVLIVARGLEPGDPSVASERALSDAEIAAAEALKGIEAHDLPTIAEWRSAFAEFGVKPREARSSAEALLRRAGSGLPRIDRLTDTYNAVSVIHQVPIGGEDLTGYVGAPRLVVARGDETFDTVADGEPVIQTATAGEVIWRDGAGVTCRRWNWRQCIRTRLTTDTADALFIIDGLGLGAQDRVTAAADDLAQRLLIDSPEATLIRRVMNA